MLEQNHACKRINFDLPEESDSSTSEKEATDLNSETKQSENFETGPLVEPETLPKNAWMVVKNSKCVMQNELWQRGVSGSQCVIND